MKSLSVSLLVVFLISLCSTSLVMASVEKVLICHKQNCPEGSVHGNSSITLEIQENALQLHIDHGDILGACEAECESDVDCEEGFICDPENTGECVFDGCESSEDCDENQVCDTQTGECLDTNESCNDVVCDEGFGCVFGNCFALVINNGEQGPTGPGGSNGLDGQDGVAGLDGEDGASGDGGSCTVITVGNCAAINCDDGTDALVCNGQDGSSCLIEEVDGKVLINCPDGTSVVVGYAGFDDDSGGVTNDIDRCPGAPQNFLVDEVGCALVQEQPPLPNNQECDFGIDLLGGEQEGHFCGLCGNGCGLSFAMLFIGLTFLRKRGV